MNNSDLAARIARDIFTIKPYMGAPPIRRLVLMAGKYPDCERDVGGLCEGALADRIEEALERASE